MDLQRAAFDGAAALEEFGQLHADGIESRRAQLSRESRCGSGEHHVVAVGDRVEGENLRIGGGDLDRIGEQGAQAVARRRIEGRGW